MRPAASAGNRGELWAPHRRPSALKGLGGDTQILLLSRYLGVPPGVNSPAPRSLGQACQAGSTQSTEQHVPRVKCSSGWT